MSKASAWASIAFEHLVAILAPPHCAACDAPVRLLAVFCEACAATVEHAPADGQKRSGAGDGGDDGEPALSALVYGGAVADGLTRLKYGARPDLARPFGDLLCRAADGRPDLFASPHTVVVPVPLHAMRLAERGFNQSALIARRLARHVRAPLSALAVARVRNTPRQVGLDRAARLDNLRGAFLVAKPAAVRGRNVILVDDVCTTGATLRAVSAALREAGASSVAGVVVARALHGTV
ncbi:MAG: ComF family protein [Polyangiaceae bacterium]